MRKLVNSNRKNFTKPFLFEVVDEEQALNLQGGLKNEEDLFSNNIDVDNMWHRATSILDDLV